MSIPVHIITEQHIIWQSLINSDPFQMKMVNDPINTLSFQKQIEKWSWLCESYMTALDDVCINFGGTL